MIFDWTNSKEPEAQSVGVVERSDYIFAKVYDFITCVLDIAPKPLIVSLQF